VHKGLAPSSDLGSLANKRGLLSFVLF